MKIQVSNVVFKGYLSDSLSDAKKDLISKRADLAEADSKGQKRKVAKLTNDVFVAEERINSIKALRESIAQLSLSEEKVEKFADLYGEVCPVPKNFVSAQIGKKEQLIERALAHFNGLKTVGVIMSDYNLEVHSLMMKAIRDIKKGV